MNTILKALVAAAPALVITGPLPADIVNTPATRSATQPSAPALVQSNDPLVIPDGTSPQNPGAQMPQQVQFNPAVFINGLRG
jgi:hypothetical protein